MMKRNAEIGLFTKPSTLTGSLDDFVKRPRSRRANLVARGVLEVRRSASEMKRNAEIGLFTKSSFLG